MQSSALIQRAERQVSCPLRDEAAILNLTTGVYYGLDPVGARIWKMLGGPTTVADIRDALLRTYDVDAEQCERDLAAILEKLEAEGLVELRAGHDS